MIDLLLIDALSGADAGNVAVEADSWFVGFQAIAKGDRIALSPTLSSCVCAWRSSTGAGAMRVIWTSADGLQNADSATSVIVQPAMAEFI